jgi:hypothetical protein
MSYGQKNYLEIQGISGKYRISQIGCFITAFANLLDRFGRGVGSPIEVNRILRDGNYYVDVDDGIRDDVGYSTVSRINPNIAISRTGKGLPPSNNCIVKFTGLSGFGTHFCLVADAAQGLIVDSWDGVVKHWSTYKDPDEWAEYVDNTPAPTPPPAPAPAVEASQQPEVINITVQAGWGITHVLKAAGYSQAQYEDPREWDRLAALNGSATRLRLQPNQVVKVNRVPLPLVEASITPEVPATPAPEPVTPPAPVEVPQTPAAEPETTEDGAVTVPVTVIHVDPNAYKSTLVPENKVYIAVTSKVIEDFDGLNMKLQLVAGQKVTSGASFEKEIVVDGEKKTARFILSKSHYNGGNDIKWYGINTDLLSPPKDPNAYVGTLVKDDEDDDSLFDLDLAMEAKEALGNLTRHEKFIDILGRLFDMLTKFKIWNKNKAA